MKRVWIFAISFILVSSASIGISCQFGANPKVKRKVQLIKQSLKDHGYAPNWIVVSEKRSKFVNRLLPNSAKKSHHLTGDAIDVFVFDVDGDGHFNNADLKLVKKHNRLVEKSHPELRGAFGTYTNTITSSRTIHFDTRGRSIEYNH